MSIIVIGYVTFMTINNPATNDDIINKLDEYFIDENGEIVIGEIEIPEDLTETDVLNEIDDYLLKSDEEIDIGNMNDVIE
jgi:hypothetical protein